MKRTGRHSDSLDDLRECEEALGVGVREGVVAWREESRSTGSPAVIGVEKKARTRRDGRRSSGGQATGEESDVLSLVVADLNEVGVGRV